MFRVIVICGCLMAIAQAGVISGGLITGVPLSVQPAFTYRPAAAAVALPATANSATSSSNIVRGIGPVAAVYGGRGLVSGAELVTGIGAPGLSIGSYGVY